jgi:predicted deacetylase
LARELVARARGGAVRLHQHGYAHANHEPTGRKCEFGASRPVEMQAADIAAGRDRLAHRLHDVVDPAFTPPWNRCTAETADVLAANGFRVLSRDVTAEPFARPDLAEVPITVDWFGHRKGRRWSRQELGRRLGEGLRAGGPVGLMLHHALMDDEERGGVAELLAAVGGSLVVRPSTILELHMVGSSRIGNKSKSTGE